MIIELKYGMLNVTLEQQLNKQGCTLGDKAELYEDIRKAIFMCKYHVATKSQADAMFKKLTKKLLKDVRERK